VQTLQARRQLGCGLIYILGAGVTRRGDRLFDQLEQGLERAVNGPNIAFG